MQSLGALATRAERASYADVLAFDSFEVLVEESRSVPFRAT